MQPDHPTHTQNDSSTTLDACKSDRETDGNLQPKMQTNMAASSVCTLCVGGSTFSTTLSTLTSVPDSYLGVLFGSSSTWAPSSLLPDGTPFIDRDADLFRYVLGYLRSLRDGGQQPLLLPDSPVQLQQLKAEADFYGLPGLAAICSLGRGSHTQTAGAWARVAALQHQHQQQVAAGRQQQQESLELLPQQLQRQHCSEQQLAMNGTPLSAAEVELSLSEEEQQHSGRASLAAAMLQAQLLRAEQQQGWAQDEALQQYAGIVVRHMLQLPLAAQQPDLVAALADGQAGTRLEFRFAYYPVGDLRIDLQCRVLPPGSDQATAIAAAAAAAGAGAARGSSPSPAASPRDSREQQQQQVYRRNTVSGEVHAASADGSGPRAGGGRHYSGSLSPEAAGVAAVAAAAAATAAVTSYTGAAVMPGPGWGAATMYHRYCIREAPDRFVLTTHSPGEAQEVQETPHAAFRQDLKRYAGLHKLGVQQCPRSSVAGLVWLLEEAGFSSVQLSTCLEGYCVGHNTFSGFVSVLTCGL